MSTTTIPVVLKQTRAGYPAGETGTMICKPALIKYQPYPNSKWFGYELFFVVYLSNGITSLNLAGVNKFLEIEPCTIHCKI